MDIGKQVVNWKGDAGKKCYCIECGPIPMNQDGSPAKVNILLHERGLKIVSNLFMDLLAFHESQIVSLRQEVENYQSGNSVIGRITGLGIKHPTLYVLYITYQESNITREAVFASPSSFESLVKRAQSSLKMAEEIKNPQKPNNGLYRDEDESAKIAALGEYKQLLDAGILSEEEYESVKRRILG